MLSTVVLMFVFEFWLDRLFQNGGRDCLGETLPKLNDNNLQTLLFRIP